MVGRILLVNEFSTELDPVRGAFIDAGDLRVWFTPDNYASRYLVTKGFNTKHSDPTPLKIGVIINWLFFERLKITSNGASNARFLMRALKNNFSDDLLEALIIKGACYQSGGNFLGFNLTGTEVLLLFAALTSYSDHLFTLIKCFPEGVKKILRILDYIQDEGRGSARSIYFEINGKRWDLRRKSELKDNFLTALELAIDSQIAAATTIAACCQIYQAYLASTEAKVLRSAYGCLSYFSYPVYKEKKIQQIGALQEKLLNLAREADSDVCLELFNHDVFSSRHNQFGVDKGYRNGLEKMANSSSNLERKNPPAISLRMC